MQLWSSEIAAAEEVVAYIYILLFCVIVLNVDYSVPMAKGYNCLYGHCTLQNLLFCVIVVNGTCLEFKEAL